ncbi:MAG: GspE/PulE family protein [Candidatus Paceibacterota bacterium]
MQLDTKQLKQFVLDAGLISGADFDAADKLAKEKDRTVGDVLVSEGKITEDEFRRVQAYLFGIPFISLKGQKIDPKLLAIIPEPIARKHNVLAYARDKDNNIEVAMLDPQDVEAIEFIAKRTGVRILPRLTDTESIKGGLIQYQKSLRDEFGSIISSEARKIGGRGETSAETGGLTSAAENVRGLTSGPEVDPDLAKLAEDVPVVRIVDALLEHAILQQASDIHIEPFEGQLVIRYRIDGILHDAMILPIAAASGIVARIKVLSHLRLDEKRLPQDGRFKIDNAETGQKVSFRVSLLPTYFGEKVVMRLLPDTAKGFTLEVLGFHGAGLEAIHDAMRQTTGIILATGPTGSGKTTTLYTMIDTLNTPDVNISTIEDPIEYQMGRVNQTQVKPDIGLTFGAGLRALMRQDPNIIMVGEIRDKETASLAINAALTGHLVLSTLHTNSAAGAVPRLIDMGVEPFLLVSTLNVVIAQRLVRRLHHVNEKYTLTAGEIESLKKHINLDVVLQKLREEKIVGPTDDFSKIQFCRPKPSPDCPDGYKSRVGIHEIMKMTPAIKELIIKNASDADLERTARAAGMLTMFEDGIFKAAQGVTSIEEVLRVANE